MINSRLMANRIIILIIIWIAIKIQTKINKWTQNWLKMGMTLFKSLRITQMSKHKLLSAIIKTKFLQIITKIKIQ